MDVDLWLSMNIKTIFCLCNEEPWAEEMMKKERTHTHTACERLWTFYRVSCSLYIRKFFIIHFDLRIFCVLMCEGVEYFCCRCLCNQFNQILWVRHTIFTKESKDNMKKRQQQRHEDLCKEKNIFSCFFAIPLSIIRFCIFRFQLLMRYSLYRYQCCVKNLCLITLYRKSNVDIDFLSCFFFI